MLRVYFKKKEELEYENVLGLLYPKVLKKYAILFIQLLFW